MAQHIHRHQVKRNTPQHKVLQLLRQRGALSVKELIEAAIYSPQVSSGWVGRVQTLLDRGLITIINTDRMISVLCVGANDKPERLQITLTSTAMSELRRLDPIETPKPERPAPVVAHPYRATPRFHDLPVQMERPPVPRAGSLDFALCPSIVGDKRVEYAPHC